jgi:hypothetical protein
MTTTEQPFRQEAAPGEAVSGREWLVAALAGLGVSLAIIAPFFWLGAPSGHDFDFHAASWLEVRSQWQAHIGYPRWHASANHGFGEPRFIFYPPLSWMLGAALGFLVHWSAVPGLFVVVVQTLASVGAFALARRWLSFRGALAAGAFYAANPYALLVVYVRSDFAEQLASALLPLLFACAFDLTAWSRREQRTKGRILRFALLFAAIWLSNAPAGVLASYTMSLWIVWVALVRRNWRVLADGAAALALGLGLAAFYLVPAAYEQRWVNISQVLSRGLQPQENFLYTTSSDPQHTFFNWMASTIAVLLVVLTGATAAATLGRESRPDAESGPARRSAFLGLVVLSGAATLLMLRSSAFAWTLLPKLRFVQFPWRWMLILAVPCAVFVGACGLRRLGPLWVASALALSVLTGVYLGRHTWWEPDEMTAFEAMFASTGFEGTDEYDPAGDDHDDLPKAAPHVLILASEEGGARPAAAVTVLGWEAERKLLRVHASEPARVALRLLDYPAWRVEVNGRALLPEHVEGTRQMVVEVPAGVSEIQVQFRRTADRTIGGVISLVALFLAATLAVFPLTPGAGDKVYDSSP